MTDAEHRIAAGRGAFGEYGASGAGASTGKLSVSVAGGQAAGSSCAVENIASSTTSESEELETFSDPNALDSNPKVAVDALPKIIASSQADGPSRAGHVSQKRWWIARVQVAKEWLDKCQFGIRAMSDPHLTMPLG